MEKLKFYNDSGHGWLEIPLTVIPPEVLANVSDYSYHDKACGLVYLEEDCDAPLVMKALGLTNSDVDDVIVDGHCFIRSLNSFKGGAK